MNNFFASAGPRQFVRGRSAACASMIKSRHQECHVPNYFQRDIICQNTSIISMGLPQHVPTGISSSPYGSFSKQQQFRWFDARRKKKKPKMKNPWKILGIKESDQLPYKKVKTIFLKLAMANHPDTHEAESEEDAEKMRDKFIKARMAFESLTEGPDGLAIRKEDYEDAMENFDSWFKQETGHDTPFSFLDPETMKEVALMTDEVGSGDAGGLDRDGGMWALARMVRSTVKAGGDAGAMLRLESGDVKEQHVGGGLRRKRRR